MMHGDPSFESHLNRRLVVTRASDQAVSAKPDSRPVRCSNARRGRHLLRTVRIVDHLALCFPCAKARGMVYVDWAALPDA